MTDFELAQELRKIAKKQQNFYHEHVLNTAAERLEEKNKEVDHDN